MRNVSLLFLLANRIRCNSSSRLISRKILYWIGLPSLILVILCGSSAFGQNISVQDSSTHYKYTFPQFFSETGSFFIQPAKWEGSDWLKLGLIGAGTFLIMQTADQPFRDVVLRDGKRDADGLFIKESQKYFRSIPIEAGRVWGELYAPILLFSGFAAYSLITNDIVTRKIAYEIGQASLYAGGLTFLLKIAIGRARPYTEEGTTSFYPFSSIFVQDNHSMPGGHMTAAMVLSTVLSRNAKPVWLKVLAYLPAALTFVSRPYQDQHWMSGEFVGAALGYFIATWVVDQHEKVDRKNGKESILGIQGMNIQPYLLGDSYGLGLTLHL